MEQKTLFWRLCERRMKSTKMKFSGVIRAAITRSLARCAMAGATLHF
jgi:hypothetical protein